MVFVQVWSECEGGRVCLVREGAAGLLLPGNGETPTKTHKVPLPHSFHAVTDFHFSYSQTQSRPVTVLGPGHMASDGDHVTSREGAGPTSDPTTDAPLGSRVDGGGLASSQEQGKK